MAADTAEACAINIGPQERRRRRIVGVVFLVVSAGVAAVLLASGVGRLWRLALFLPLWPSGVGFFQAFDKT
jgi:hypothetical protein